MFGDLMGNVEKQQAEMQKMLAGIHIEEKLEGITITANAARKIINVSFEESFLKNTDKEELEDLMLTCMNRLMEKITETEASASQKMMQEILPPGFSELFGK